MSLAPGLATFINCSQESFRLIISPLLRAEDKEAIEEGIASPEDIAITTLKDIIVTEDLVEQHTLKCLSWLLRSGRVKIKIALMKDALFHPKVWLFRGDGDVIAAHGSSNMTDAGIRKNIEQISISKSWEDPTQHYITEKFCDQFKRLWENEDDSCIVVALPQAIREKSVANLPFRHSTNRDRPSDTLPPSGWNHKRISWQLTSHLSYLVLHLRYHQNFDLRMAHLNIKAKL